MNTLRFWTVTVLMCLAAAFLYIRGDTDRVLPSEPLADLPTSIGPLTATDIPLDQEVLDVLGKGVFLNRLYKPISSTGELGSDAPISLFIGYFPTQRTGQSIHSPQNCLPGAGWSFLSSGVTDLTDPSGRKYTVGDYLISDGRSTQEVLYWYRIHGRSVASDYRAKFDTIADSIRFNRTDAALIRIITPVLPGEPRSAAHNRATHFADLLVPMLPAYIPN